MRHGGWSALPDATQLTGGRIAVPHFTSKAQAEATIAGAGFKHYTFVEAPFYFQNLTGMLAPQLGDDGVRTWALPMDPTKKVIHGGDISELGKVVAAAFGAPDKVGAGQHLAMAGDTLSWDDIVAALTKLGHKVRYTRVPADVFDGFFPPAKEIRLMFEYFEELTYFGPDAEKKLALAKELVPGGFTSFADWAAKNFPAA